MVTETGEGSPPSDPVGLQPGRVIGVRRAREHNLRGVDVDLPRDALVVVTGVSGSGKSSLAFGTIYAEAQSRWLESVTPYARRLMSQVGAPAVDEIFGLPPAIAMRQARSTPGSRSTVGTVTTLSNSLRMLFSRAGYYPAGAARLDSDAFSPNTPAGACPTCHGLGRVHEATEASLVPDPNLSIRERAVAAWPGAWQGKNYRDILATLGYDVDRPWRDLDQADRDWILFTDEQPVVEVHAEREAHRIQRPYRGTYQSARRYVLHTLSETGSATLRRRVLRFVEVRPCPTCAGSGLRAAATAVTIAGRTITELTALPLTALAEALADVLVDTVAGIAAETGSEGGGGTAAGTLADSVAATIVPDILARIDVLTRLGLGYLSTARATATLSAGELQRLRIATATRSTLFGVLYVLDEPSAGLHPADVTALLDVLGRLRASGNSLLVVEHDLDVMRGADWLVDIGPGAGVNGGRLLHSGPADALREVSASATRTYLFPAAAPHARSARPAAGTLRLRGVTAHNLDGLDVDIPLGVFTAVTGVSGSGKSTLITRVLAAAVRERLGGATADVGDGESDDENDSGSDGEPDGGGRTGYASGIHGEVSGIEQLDRLVQIDQRPIGRTPRSNLATYTGLFDRVRKLFAATDQARERGYSVSRFSFNVAGGRCETCQGEGFVTVELLFLPGTYAPCPACHGARYEPDTLAVRYRARSIADVLAMTVDEAAVFFADDRAVSASLRALARIGLGYLGLGQPATDLSGGEAQRVKLATELQRVRRDRALYLLDEPTTGLHPADVESLSALLHELVDAGSSVVVVEHDLSMIAGADHVIDLGPGGGPAGGRLVASGTPREIADTAESITGKYLRRYLDRSA